MQEYNIKGSSACLNRTQISSSLNLYFLAAPGLTTRRLNDLGIHSLAAVDIRAWFMKTAEVKIPLPKILNGASVGKLLALAVGNIRARLIPNRKSTAEYSGSETIKSAIHDPNERDNGSSGTSDIQRDLASTASDTDCDHSWIEDSDSILLKIIPLSSSQAESWATFPHVEGGTGLDRSLSARINSHLRIDNLKSAGLAMGGPIA